MEKKAVRDTETKIWFWSSQGHPTSRGSVYVMTDNTEFRTMTSADGDHVSSEQEEATCSLTTDNYSW